MDREFKVKYKTTQLLENNIEEILGLMVTFYVHNWKYKPCKNNNKLDYIKIKNFYSAKDIVKKLKDHPNIGRKYFAKYKFDETVVSKIYKESLKFTKKINNPILKKGN